MLAAEPATNTDMARPADRLSWVALRSMALINLAAIAERADEGLLPAVYREVGITFSATPSQLGSLTFIRAVVQALFSPFAGFLALHYDRATVVGLGTLFWALSTAAVGLAQTYWQCAFWRAVNGVGLAIVVPAMQSFVADSYGEGQRGVAFGVMGFVGTVGGICGGMAATVLAGYPELMGVAGWRFAFLGMAVLSTGVGCLVYFYVVDPRGALPSLTPPGAHKLAEKRDEYGQRIGWRETWAGMKSVLAVRTFQLIVCQGVIGSLPWQAMVFFTLWFQLLGFGHNGSALLVGLFSAGIALGGLFGGWAGDRAARLRPASGRILCAQVSAAMGIPFAWVLLLGLPQGAPAWGRFAATLVAGGLLVSWNGAACNNPLFAEVVPPALRTTIYAFDRGFEGAVAALAAPIVGLLAEHAFGYSAARAAAAGVAGSPAEARALSRGLFACMAVPWGLCSLAYTPLYVTYSRDKERAESSLMHDVGGGLEVELPLKRDM